MVEVTYEVDWRATVGIVGQTMRLTGLSIEVVSSSPKGERGLVLTLAVARERATYLGVPADIAVQKFVSVEVSRLCGRRCEPVDYVVL